MIPETYFWIAITVMGVSVWLIRFSFMPVVDKVEQNERVDRVLNRIPAAVLSAMAVPAILLHSGGGIGEGRPDRLLPALLAGVVAWKSKNLFLTILTGLLALWAQRMIYAL